MYDVPNQTTSAMTHIDLTVDELISLALERGEGMLAANNALSVNTGSRTGRSAKDKFIVRDALTQDTVAWGPINQPISSEQFDALWKKVNNYLEGADHFISHLRVGADKQHYLPVTVITELAWQNLFAKQLFINTAAEISTKNPEWTLVSAPNFHATPEIDGTHSEAAIMINFQRRRILICGTHYAGELKKSMFSILNYLLPEQDILPMHCAANVSHNGQVALFFGLSGTGKTTLSADPKRLLIGDDEHGWSANGVFNFEGGCYAKCIHLSQEKEPVIWDAISRGAIMENVVLDSVSKKPDFDNNYFSENTRVAYPLEHIPNRVIANQAGHPEAVIFLCCDLYGVLPPVAQLSQHQAAYYFLSGYTALLGSTEVNQAAAITPTFSCCFGAPFFPRHAQTYANLLCKRLQETGANVYLVNTGWTGGSYGNGGERFSIPTTRGIIDAILSGEVNAAEKTQLPHFNVAIPKQLSKIPAELLDPSNGWSDKAAYAQTVNTLIQQFQANFKQHDVSAEILAAGPTT